MNELYRKNEPKGWVGDRTRGSAQGRRARIPPGTAPSCRLYASRIRLTREGYDRLGTYWGSTSPLFWVHNADATVEIFVQAPTRRGALEQARKGIQEAADAAQ